MLEENAKTLKSKVNILEEDNKIIEALERDIQFLMNGQDSIKKSQSKSYPERNIKAMEEEIEDIIAEQWIQIRKFEQAFVLTKMMTSKVHERSRSSETVYKWPRKDIVLKASRFCKAIRRQYIPDIDGTNVFLLGGSISRSCISLPYNQFKISMSSAQKFHHKIQVFLQDAMRSNRYSRRLANELITFCLVSTFEPTQLVGVTSIGLQ